MQQIFNLEGELDKTNHDAFLQSKIRKVKVHLTQHLKHIWLLLDYKSLNQFAKELKAQINNEG